MKMEKRGLGRGLSALISPEAVSLHVDGSNARVAEESIVARIAPQLVDVGSSGGIEVTPQSGGGAANVKFLLIDSVEGNPSQPRQFFAESELDELAGSIKTLGVLQPILVRPRGSMYEIVAGERRWRAAQRAGLKEIPAIIRELSEYELLQIALVENVQRQQLTPVEEAYAYDRLIREFKLTQEQVAEAVGKNRVSIANYLRLLKLAPEVLAMLEDSRISMGHAKALLTIKEPAAQVNLGRKIVEEGLSVRSVEAIVARVIILESKKPLKRSLLAEGANASDHPFSHIEDQLRGHLGTRVAIRPAAGGKGRIEIDYFSEEELSRLVELIAE
jgi:ParB family chromosome partitioning protein